MVSCYSESPLHAEIFAVHPFNYCVWWPMLLEIICPSCPAIFQKYKTYHILHLETFNSFTHMPVDCKREMHCFKQYCQLLRLHRWIKYEGGALVEWQAKTKGLRRKSSIILSTTNPTRIDLGSKPAPVVRDQQLHNCLGHSTAQIDCITVRKYHSSSNIYASYFTYYAKYLWFVNCNY